jgi:tetratricopeptide (TPR) repeat protein
MDAMGDEGVLARERVLEWLKGDGSAAPRVAAQAYLEQNPEDAEVQTYLANLLVKLRRWDQAGPLLVNLLNSEESFSRILARMDMAELAWGRGRLGQAERHLRVQVERDPHHADGHIRLGELLDAAGRGEEAEACFREGTGGTSTPGQARAWTALGRSLVRQRRYGEALVALESSLRLDPGEQAATRRLMEDAQGAAGDPGARLERSQVLGFFGRDEFATFREHAEIYLERDPSDDQVSISLGAALLGLSDYSGAEAILERSLARGADPPLLQFATVYLGRVSKATGDYARAERYYKEAICRFPGHAGAHIHLGCLFAVQGRLEEAILAHREGTCCADGCPDEAWFNAGLVLRALERYDEAVQAMERAIELDPAYGAAKEELADCREAMQLRRELGIA